MPFGPGEPHPRHPELAWVVIEQPRGERHRMEFRPQRGVFVSTEQESLLYVRRFKGACGWVAGFGEPPAPHFEVLVLTNAQPQPGEVLEVRVAGLFKRAEGDHELLAVDVHESPPHGAVDLQDLPTPTLAMLDRLYPEVGAGEGWYGVEEARAFLAAGVPAQR